MMSPKRNVSNRISEAKLKLTPRKSASFVKHVIREKFLDRMKSSRNRNFDQFRRFIDSCPFENVEGLKRALESVPVSELVIDKDIIEFLEEIQEEVADLENQNQGEAYEQIVENETSNIIDTHLNFCSICQNITPYVGICQICSDKLMCNFLS